MWRVKISGKKIIIFKPAELRKKFAYSSAK